MIARRRKRPRVRSISLRTFGWLCRVQAVYQLFPQPIAYTQSQLFRLALLRLTADAHRRLARPYLAVNPYRKD